MGRKSLSAEEAARAWAALLKHGTKEAQQRDHEPGDLVRLDLLITQDDMRTLCALVEEVNWQSPRRLTRAEVGRHLISRSISLAAAAQLGNTAG